MSGVIRHFFPVYGGADDPTRISGPLPAREKIADLRMVKAVGITWNTNRRRCSRLRGHHNRIPRIVTVLFFSKQTESFSERFPDKGRKHIF